MKRVYLRPRLLAAADGLPRVDCAADVGCDHGRLGAWLLQQERAQRLIGVDISGPSLEKAAQLRGLCALEERWELRVGDGLCALSPGEAQAIALCGMGGELIADLLEAAPAVARAAQCLCLQPMGGTAELRAYLYGHGYRITAERIALDAGRYYQILQVRSGAPLPLPPGFPSEAYTFGALSFVQADPLLLPLLRRYREALWRAWEAARRRGQSPAPLQERLAQADRLIELALQYQEEAQ